MPKGRVRLLVIGLLGLCALTCLCSTLIVALSPSKQAAASTVMPTVTDAPRPVAPSATDRPIDVPTVKPQPTQTPVPTRQPQATNAPAPTSKAQATNAPQPTIKQTTPTPTPTLAATTGRYVASSQAKTYFYCVTDPAWKALKAGLIWSDDPQIFIAQGLKLHAPCK